MTSHRRVFSGLLLVAALSLLAGCFGTFSLTRTVYRANRNVYSSVPGDSTQRKMVQSAVMWLFIPVYAVSGVADAVVFNLIEFWTGRSTEIGLTREVGDTAVTLAPSTDGREATLTITREGKVLSRERLIKTSDRTLEIRDEQGGLRGRMVQTPAGAFEFFDDGGRMLRTASAQ